MELPASLGSVTQLPPPPFPLLAEPADGPDFVVSIPCRCCEDGRIDVSWVTRPATARDPYDYDFASVECDACAGFARQTVVGKRIDGQWWVCVQPARQPRGWLVLGAAHLGVCRSEADARHGRIADGDVADPRSEHDAAVLRAMGFANATGVTL